VSTNGHRDPRAAGRAGGDDLEGQLEEGGDGPPGGGSPRFRLRAALELFFAADGDAYFVRAGTREQHVVRDPDTVERDLLRRLARDGVEVEPSSATAARIAPLVAAGVVVSEPRPAALGATDAERFARQLPYMEDFGDPVEIQRRLRGASIAVLGCGGLGTWAVGALASLGIGRLVLIDDDTVDLSNLNYQILYGAGDVGASKVPRCGLAAPLRSHNRSRGPS
jgi:hypothetical protein